MHKISLLLLALLLPSCATKFTQAQRDQLRNISVQTNYEESAYNEPIGNGNINANAASFGGGLFGQVLAEGIAASQRSSFNKKYGDATTRSKNSIPHNLNYLISQKTGARLNEHPFFKGKIRSQSNNQIKIKILAYGYVRNEKSSGKVLMTPYIDCAVSIYTGETRISKLGIFGARTYAPNQGGHEITTYANNPNLGKHDFTKACDMVVDKICERIEKKL